MTNLDRNEEIVTRYYETNGRAVVELADKFKLDPEDIYNIVRAGGADVPTKGAQPKRAAAPTWAGSANLSVPQRRRQDGRPGLTSPKLAEAPEHVPSRVRSHSAEIVRKAVVAHTSVPKLAEEYQCTRAAIYQVLNAAGYGTGPGMKPISVKAPKPPKEPKPPRERAPLRDSGGVQRRFVGYKAQPAKVKGLPADHPAIVEGRTLFPSTVVGPWASPRFLVPGVNSPKTGGRVTKGEWAGLPIFTLTLEERRTCPRSCEVWDVCYGNGMQWPRRNDAFDPDFMPALACEVITLTRANPKGILIRLHILGDFFHPKYVRVWGHLLEMLPGLHVFGYTARRIEDPDPWSAEIAREVQALNERWPDRWVIRTSSAAPGPMRTIVVDSDPEEPMVIVCPAMTEKTDCCATCGLCWANAARAKTVAFLKHGNF